MMDADKISEDDWERLEALKRNEREKDYPEIKPDDKAEYQLYREKLKPKKVVRKFFKHIRNNLK